MEKYSKSKGVIHTSHFETTGLIGMEVLCCGGKLSITDNKYTREYYEGFAHFCDPNEVVSISEGLDWVCESQEYSGRFIPSTWEEIGKSLEEVYLKVLKRDEV